jgi:hypothetical protein
MPRIKYEDFDLLIVRGSRGSYRAKVLESHGGDAGSDFRISNLAVEGFMSPGGLPGNEAAKAFGERLFKAVFKDEVSGCLKSCLDQARQRKARLRIRLNLTEVPELGCLPWEFLRNPRIQHFYSRFTETPMVRYLEYGSPRNCLAVKPPLRMLVILSSPSDYPPLELEAEYEKLKAELVPLTKQNLLTIQKLPAATTKALLDELLEGLRHNPFHIIHFMGHGEFDSDTGKGYLVFEDEDKRATKISGEAMGNILRDHDTLRLAVINACEGARISEEDSYAGTAQGLLNHGNVPAVVAMQFPVTDKSAIDFASQFYKAIAAGYPVEAALSEGRKAISLDEDSVEWGSPVLYMRSRDGQLFDIKQPPPPPNGSKLVATPAVVPDVSISTSSDPLSAHYKSVVEALFDGQLVPFLGMDVNLYGREPIDEWNLGDPLPGNQELAGYLARLFNYPSRRQLSLVSVSQHAAFMTSMGKTDDALSRVFRARCEPNALHGFFADLAVALETKNCLRVSEPDASLRRFLIVTTNYDDLLERAFTRVVPACEVMSYVARGDSKERFLHSSFKGSRFEGTQTIDTPNDYRGLVDHNPVILNLQGVIKTIEWTCAITEDHSIDYLSRKNISSLLPSQLKEKLKRSSFLFLGCSVREWNVRALLYHIWDGPKPNYESWVVHPNPQDIDRKFWKACGVEIIDTSYETYINGLMKRLQEMKIMEVSHA